MSFLVGHLYLITTGDTLSSNLKAMITGWEELEDAPPAVAAEPRGSTAEVPA